jgi:hypothetical protein
MMKCFNSGTDSKYFIKKNICERMPENIESYIDLEGFHGYFFKGLVMRKERFIMITTLR